MSDNAITARPYAQAIFELAKETVDYDYWSNVLIVIGEVISEPEVRAIFANPRISRSDVAKVLISCCGDLLTENGKNFVHLLIRNQRLTALESISQQYESLRANAEQMVQAELESAQPVSDNQKNRISEALEKRLGMRVKLKVTINTALVGGAVVRADDLVIDGSVRARLQKLSAAVGN